MAQTTGRNLPPPQEPFVDSGTLNLSYSGYQYLLSLLASAASSQATASVSTALKSTGTNQATALFLSSQWNEVDTVPTGTGVLLSTYQPGQSQTVFNADPSNTLNVYPPPGFQINTLGLNVAFSLVPGARATFDFTTADQIWT
jgi:hypothetical protein